MNLQLDRRVRFSLEMIGHLDRKDCGDFRLEEQVDNQVQEQRR